MKNKLKEANDIIFDLLQVVESLMPGIKYIAVQDYSMLNDVPIRAKKFLKEKGD